MHSVVHAAYRERVERAERRGLVTTFRPSESLEDRGSSSFFSGWSCAGLFIAAVLGPGLMVTSAFHAGKLHAGGGNELDTRRAERLRSFGGAIRRWEAERHQLEALNVTVVLGETARPLSVLRLSAANDTEALADREAPRWRPLVFRGAVLDAPPVEASWRHPYSLRVTLEVGGAVDGRPLSVRVPLAVDLTRVEHVRANGWKDCLHARHGSFRPGNCSSFYALSSLCIAADLAALRRGAPPPPPPPPGGSR